MAAVATQPKVCAGETCVNVEIAASSAAMQKGLQGRESLGADEGLLFVFPDDSLHQFWMKGMKIPIDIIWLDANKQVASIVAGAEPCTEEPCKIYHPSQTGRHVLEVNAGFCATHNIKVGTQLEFKDIPKEFLGGQ